MKAYKINHCIYDVDDSVDEKQALKLVAIMYFDDHNELAEKKYSEEVVVETPTGPKRVEVFSWLEVRRTARVL